MQIALWILASLGSLLLLGIAYQRLGSLRDRRRHTGHGRWVNIRRGCNLFFFEVGEGAPTVVFESGIGATHLNWRGIQDEVSALTRTVSYDRAGLGWSSPTHAPRTPGMIARELHQMLNAAGIEPPYILVGHSFGGLVMRRFALLYPEAVAGVVLVDPMRLEEWPPLNPERQSQLNRGKRLIGYTAPAVRCGLARFLVKALMGRCSESSRCVNGAQQRHVLGRIRTEVRKLPCKVWPAVAAHWSRPEFYAGLRRHLDSIPESVREMQTAKPIRGIPVTVLTPGNAVPLTRDQLHVIGDSARQILALDSEHWIHLDEPELVVRVIRNLLGASASAGCEDTIKISPVCPALPIGDALLSAPRF